jgi:hypothetical protein
MGIRHHCVPHACGTDKESAAGKQVACGNFLMEFSKVKEEMVWEKGWHCCLCCHLPLQLVALSRNEADLRSCAAMADDVATVNGLRCKTMQDGMLPCSRTFHLQPLLCVAAERHAGARRCPAQNELAAESLESAPTQEEGSTFR